MDHYLPVEFRGGGREALELAGVEFGDYDASRLYRRVTLPPGWYLEASPRSAVYQDLFDECCRMRAVIYDSSRGQRPLRRRMVFGQTLARFGAYAVLAADFTTYEETPCRAVVMDQEVEIWRGEPRYPTPERAWRTLQEELEAEGEAWLDEQYPNWRVLTAYWDTETETVR